MCVQIYRSAFASLPHKTPPFFVYVSSLTQPAQLHADVPRSFPLLQAQGGALPAFVADLAEEEQLQQQLLDAVDTQSQATLPLEYHAMEILVGALNQRFKQLNQWDRLIGTRRDPAHAIPAPPEEPKGRASEAAWQRYRNELEDTWWPEFEHHARMVVASRHVHVHCPSCWKYKRGQTGCRMCAPWAHDINKTRLVELVCEECEEEPDEDEPGEEEPGEEAASSPGSSSEAAGEEEPGELVCEECEEEPDEEEAGEEAAGDADDSSGNDARDTDGQDTLHRPFAFASSALVCPICFAGGALDDRSLDEAARKTKVDREVARRELCYCMRPPSARAYPFRPDDRALVLEVARPLLPEPRDALPKDGALEHLVRLGRDGEQLPDFSDASVALDWLKQIIAPDQPLGKLLQRPDVKELRDALFELVKEVEPAAEEDAAAQEEAARAAERRAGTIKMLLKKLTHRELGCRQA